MPGLRRGPCLASTAGRGRRAPAANWDQSRHVPPRPRTRAGGPGRDEWAWRARVSSVASEWILHSRVIRLYGGAEAIFPAGVRRTNGVRWENYLTSRRFRKFVGL